MYNWTLVLKNGLKLLIKSPHSTVQDMINELYPTKPNNRNICVYELVNEDEFGNTSVAINGEDVVSLMYKSK